MPALCPVLVKDRESGKVKKYKSYSGFALAFGLESAHGAKYRIMRKYVEKKGKIFLVKLPDDETPWEILEKSVDDFIKKKTEKGSNARGGRVHTLCLNLNTGVIEEFKSVSDAMKHFRPISSANTARVMERGWIINTQLIKRGDDGRSWSDIYSLAARNVVSPMIDLSTIPQHQVNPVNVTPYETSDFAGGAVACKQVKLIAVNESNVKLRFTGIGEAMFVMDLDEDDVTLGIEMPYEDFHGFQFRQIGDERSFIGAEEKAKLIAEEKQRIEEVKANEEIIVIIDKYGKEYVVDNLEAVAERLNTDLETVTECLLLGKVFKTYTFKYKTRKNVADASMDVVKTVVTTQPKKAEVKFDDIKVIGPLLCMLPNGQILNYKNISAACNYARIKPDDLLRVISDRTQLLNNQLWKLKNDDKPFDINILSRNGKH